MYGWPKDLDPQELVGRTIDALTFAENVIVIAFSAALTISVSGALSYKPTKDDEPRREQAPVARTELVGAIGRQVQDIAIESPQEVVLRLEGGFSITLLDELENYESYLISFGERDIAV